VAHWDQAQIGAVLTASGLIGICAHAPIGLLIDATRAKRALVVAATLALGACAIAIERFPTGPVVFTADVVMAVLGAIFAPVIAAITLGLVAERDLAARIGRNAVFDRVGNLFIAALAGLAATWFGQRVVFYLVPMFCAPAVVAVLSIPARAIDHAKARGLTENETSGDVESGWRFFTKHRAFAGFCVLIAAFHFANSSMLPLIGQKLALSHPGYEASFMSACILVAQLAAIPSGWLVATRADSIGHWPLLFAACLLLPVRGMIFALVDNPAVLVSAQVLDGLGVGLFDALLPLILADLVRGSGRYNLARGIAGMVQGIGGSISNVVAGLVIVAYGYSAGFAALAAVSLVAVAMAANLARKSVSR
jgi:MFS family permease